MSVSRQFPVRAVHRAVLLAWALEHDALRVCAADEALKFAHIDGVIHIDKEDLFELH